MTPEVHSILARITHPQVRDLAWVIGSSHLWDPECSSVRVGEAGSLLVDSLINPTQELIRCQDHLLQLDREPQALIDSLAQSQNKHTRVRLGVYFEHLVSYWLRHIRGASRFLREIQIFQERERGRDTLGALDIVVSLPSRGEAPEEWFHYEVAVKFYLDRTSEMIPAPTHLSGASRGDALEVSRLHPSSPQLDHWVGPNERDSFGTKLRRLVDHQLPLSLHPLAQKKLKEHSIHRLAHRALWLKGRLFSNALEADLDRDDSLLLDQGHWIRKGQISDFIKRVSQTRQCLVIHRPKPLWLAPPLLTGSRLPTSIPLNELADASERASGERGSTLWYFYTLSSSAWGGWLMIVPDDWCHRSQKTYLAKDA